MEFRLTYFCTHEVIVALVFKHSSITLISLDIDDMWSVMLSDCKNLDTFSIEMMLSDFKNLDSFSIYM